MHRFFITGDYQTGDRFTITGSDVRHIVRVLRLGPGDTIALVSGAGQEYRGEITGTEAEEVVGVLVGAVTVTVEPDLQVTLFQGLPKAGKMDLIVQKCTEIGVSRIVPVLTERVIVRLEPGQAGARVERWQKIAREAASQSGRTSIPAVAGLLPFRTAVEQAAGNLDLAVIPWELARETTLKQALRSGGGIRRLGIFIGPEGGLAQSEVELAAAQGIVPVTLGPRILRTETAGLICAALALYELADLGGVTG